MPAIAAMCRNNEDDLSQLLWQRIKEISAIQDIWMAVGTCYIQREKLGTVGRVPQIYTNIYHLDMC